MAEPPTPADGPSKNSAEDPALAGLDDSDLVPPGRGSLRERLAGARSSTWLGRNGPILLGVAASLAIAPWFVAYFSSFRAVVLQHRGEETFLAFTDKTIPRWVDRTVGSPGEIVRKASGTFDAEVVAAEEQDREVLDLYARWMSTWGGTIVRLISPKVARGPYTAVLQLDDGGQRHMEIWAEHLAGAETGRRLRKHPNAWEPVFDDTTMPGPAPGSASGPGPATAATPTAKAPGFMPLPGIATPPSGAPAGSPTPAPGAAATGPAVDPSAPTGASSTAVTPTQASGPAPVTPTRPRPVPGAVVFDPTPLRQTPSR